MNLAVNSELIFGGTDERPMGRNRLFKNHLNLILCEKLVASSNY